MPMLWIRRIRLALPLALPLALVMFLADCSSKELAVEHLVTEHMPYPVIGDVVRFTLAYNDASAMGLVSGPSTRWVLIGVMSLIVVWLLYTTFTTPRRPSVRQVAIGLMLGGALGNLASRVLSARGVVDFIDVGFGAQRFYVFNIADIAITAGAILFAITSFRAVAKSETESPI